MIKIDVECCEKDSHPADHAATERRRDSGSARTGYQRARPTRRTRRRARLARQSPPCSRHYRRWMTARHPCTDTRNWNT